MRRVGGPRGATTRTQVGVPLSSGKGVGRKTTIEWERRSPRLWVGEKDGRRFRIERIGATQGTGTVVAVEVDALQKRIRSEPSMTAAHAKALIETWL